MSPTLEISRPLLVGPGGHPRILSVAAERLERYFAEPECLPTLAVLNPTGSQRRSESREASIRIGKAILKFLDLPTMTVGVRRPGEPLSPITVSVLAAHADLELRRAERALRDLARAGFITIIEQRTCNADGDYRSSPAIKRISPALFGALDLDLALRLEREKARKRLARSLEAEAQAPDQPRAPEKTVEQQSFRFAVGNLMGTLFQQPLVKSLDDQPERDIERQRRWMSIALKLREEHPDWPADDIRAAADRAMLS